MINFMDVLTAAAIVAAVPLAYAALRIGLMAATQKYRMRLAEKGEKYLARDDLDDDQRELGQMWLNTAFSSRWAWGMVALLPLVLLIVLILGALRLVGLRQRPAPGPEKLSEQDADLRELAFLSFIGSFGVSPLASLVIALEGVILTPLALVTRTFEPIKRLILRGPINISRLAH